MAAASVFYLFIFHWLSTKVSAEVHYKLQTVRCIQHPFSLHMITHVKESGQEEICTKKTAMCHPPEASSGMPSWWQFAFLLFWFLYLFIISRQNWRPKAFGSCHVVLVVLQGNTAYTDFSQATMSVHHSYIAWISWFIISRSENLYLYICVYIYHIYGIRLQ